MFSALLRALEARPTAYCSSPPQPSPPSDHSAVQDMRPLFLLLFLLSTRVMCLIRLGSEATRPSGFHFAIDAVCPSGLAISAAERDRRTSRTLPSPPDLWRLPPEAGEHNPLSSCSPSLCDGSGGSNHVVTRKVGRVVRSEMSHGAALTCLTDVLCVAVEY